ncbi:uncharacterized protein LOC119069772 [Bradysia coprophila]|uniref:uncharacterized protein LOC119069772 n=1 Tax=Bradysia coprophila TaxID=38358 RepID=UPI00187D857B|nr:uncharacterized protein LOC119069772 [Bradysia coprophila]
MMEFEVIFMLFITFVLSISIITMLAACVCCRKSVPKNELMGLEGMVKLKNPDHSSTNDVIAISNDPKSNDAEAKRSSTAPHRSLPDIPISEPPTGDTGSYDLYATVGDKVAEKPQGRSPSTSMKKLSSVSQHSSISQADDVSSPYARVRSPPHAYDKVRPAEHPYAQVKAAGPATSTSADNATSSNSDTLAPNRRDSDQSLSNEDEELSRSQVHTVSAASAIAGRISASQELPYMTPPIAPPQQHFSGDSQDSSKGYTSISVREPLANIIAQTNQQISHARRRELIDSHYATVSDDSDEMYAAIEDPNNQGDVYTSGSETYAQIQPHVSLTVAAEINNIPSTSKASDDVAKTDKSPAVDQSPQRHSIISSHHDESHLPPPVENLRSVHSRQASSSSSVGNLGSPKPEKRQANSPLPPTPKSTHYLSNSNLTNSSSVPSGRNSAASVIEVQPIGSTSRQVSRENLSTDSKKHSNDDFVRKKGHIEDLYAKVMKKNKLSNAPSQNTSPVPYRKSFQDILSRPSLYLSDPDINLDEDALSTRSNDRNSTAFVGTTTVRNDYETIDKRRQHRNINYDDQKDHGYETIPAGGSSSQTMTTTSATTGVSDDGVEQHRARSSAPAGVLAHGIQKVSQNSLVIFHGVASSEPGYESLPDNSKLSSEVDYETVMSVGEKKPNSDYDPNYEVLVRPVSDTDNLYAKVWEQPQTDDLNDGYSSIKSFKKDHSSTSTNANHNYASISESNPSDAYRIANERHNYSTISESRQGYADEVHADKLMSTSGYSTISESKTTPSSDSDTMHTGYDSVDGLRFHNYESLTGSESDPNYESVRYTSTDRNPYERLHNDSATLSPSDTLYSRLDTTSSSKGDEDPSPSSEKSNNDSVEVDDYFQV